MLAIVADKVRLWRRILEVVHGGKGQVAFGESFGFRDREVGTPMALDSIHRIACAKKTSVQYPCVFSNRPLCKI